jgi:archaellum component FlaC
MAKYSNVVSYNIKTTLDSSGITKLQSELTKLSQQVNSIGKMEWGMSSSEIERTTKQINSLQVAIVKCFNPQIGMLDLEKFNNILKTDKILVKDISTEWSKMGAQGKAAVNALASSVLTLNRDAITVNSTLSKIANTFGNTVRWGITASIFQGMMDSVSETVSYLKDLDESLTNIRLVTDYSKEDMREFAEYANQAAKALGSTTVAYTDAALVFAQQGYGLEESETLANYSIKLANVTGQSTDTTSDQITSYMNAFGISLDDLSGKLDEWAEVANISAADVEELSVAAQKAAATANAVGVSTEQLNAQIATIESVTRDAPKIILGRPIGNYWLKCA